MSSKTAFANQEVFERVCVFLRGFEFFPRCVGAGAHKLVLSRGTVEAISAEWSERVVAATCRLDGLFGQFAS
jgi:hypothetical protein